MKHKIILLLCLLIAVFFSTGFSSTGFKNNESATFLYPKFPQDSTKSKIIQTDSLTNETITLKDYKKNAHASYYANKFNGKKTASGKKFDNNKYTAAHRKFPFGTKVKVTNESNGKWVIVEITDRGPFVRGREIDLSRQAFMDIASHKNSGSVIVTIEVVTKD